MSTTIRLTRMGRKKRPFYRLVFWTAASGVTAPTWPISATTIPSATP